MEIHLRAFFVLPSALNDNCGPEYTGCDWLIFVSCLRTGEEPQPVWQPSSILFGVKNYIEWRKSFNANRCDLSGAVQRWPCHSILIAFPSISERVHSTITHKNWIIYSVKAAGNRLQIRFNPNNCKLCSLKLKADYLWCQKPPPTADEAFNFRDQIWWKNKSK